MIVAAEVPAHVSRFSEMYGHAAILREYVGAKDDRLHVVGQIQHGWSLGAGVAPEPTPLYLWNERSAAAAHTGGVDGAIIIGAPYLYLPRAASIQEIGRVPLGLLALPQHSTSGHPLADGYAAWEQYAEWLASVRVEADLEQVTVCLHENEYDDPSVRHVLLRQGLVTACCGGVRGRATSYLDRLRAFIHQHGMATSNAIGTALFYAAYEGAPVFVDGPAFARLPVKDTSERYYREVSDPAWIDANFPGWRCRWRDARPHVDDAAREVGAAHKRSVADLWASLRLAVMP
jgi:hypothetical protein